MRFMSRMPFFHAWKRGKSVWPNNGNCAGSGMTEKPESEEERASREATDWLILLQEEPDDLNLRRNFEAWLKASRVNEHAWAATRHTANTIEAARHVHTERHTRSAKRKWDTRPSGPLAGPHTLPPVTMKARRRWGLQTAALAVAVCLVFLFAPDLFLHIQADHATGTAETRVLSLADGSRIVLAPDSAIALAYSPEERRVQLLAGEAFFDVAPNPDRPFRAEIGEVSATVLGTAFNLLRENDRAVVALAEGKLHVEHPTAARPVSETLETGEIVRVTWAGDVIRSMRPPDEIAAWRTGRFIAQDETIEAVVGRLRRYYGGTIILADRNLARRSVTGVYNLRDPIDALRAIGQAHGARIRQITPWIVVISGG